jgi:hypothetical protein
VHSPIKILDPGGGFRSISLKNHGISIAYCRSSISAAGEKLSISGATENSIQVWLLIITRGVSLGQCTSYLLRDRTRRTFQFSALRLSAWSS